MTAQHLLAAGPVPNTEDWLQVAELALGLALSAVIGLEREIRQKSAGLRTHTLVGVGAALFMLISKYGFADVQIPGQVILDPSRVAAQIVSGIGFLGAGLIFVKRDSVRGLTTAASVWVTAAIGAAAGAGLPLLAAATTGGYLIVSLGLTPLAHWVARTGGRVSLLRVSYPDGRGILRQVLAMAIESGFTVDDMATRDDPRRRAEPDDPDAPAMVEVVLRMHGKGSLSGLAARLSELPQVRAVTADTLDTNGE